MENIFWNTAKWQMARHNLGSRCLYYCKSWNERVSIILEKQIYIELLLSWHVLAQSQQWKHQNNVWNLLKAKNNDNRATSLTSFWCRYFKIYTYFTNYLGVSAVDFEQVHAGWVNLTWITLIFTFILSRFSFTNNKHWNFPIQSSSSSFSVIEP